MKYKIVKLYNGDIEFVYGDEVVMLTEKNPMIILTDDEYFSIPEHKQYLITNMFVAVEVIEEIKIETKEEIKKFNK